MQYYEDGDYYICRNGKRLEVSYLPEKVRMGI